MLRSISVTVFASTVLLTAACHKSKAASPTYALPSTDRGPDRGKPAPRQPRATEVARGELHDTLLLLQRVHFALDSDRLLPAARESLTTAADRLAAHPDVQIYVDGHTDDRGTTEYNVALGERRAQVVVDYLVRLGIDRSRLAPISFGEERPIRGGGVADDLAENRRVEFRLMRGHVELVIEDGARFADDGTPLSAQLARVDHGAP